MDSCSNFALTQRIKERSLSNISYSRQLEMTEKQKIYIPRSSKAILFSRLLCFLQNVLFLTILGRRMFPLCRSAKSLRWPAAVNCQLILRWTAHNLSLYRKINSVYCQVRVLLSELTSTLDTRPTGSPGSRKENSRFLTLSTLIRILLIWLARLTSRTSRLIRTLLTSDLFLMTRPKKWF
jgi:hypothetical protein